MKKFLPLAWIIFVAIILHLYAYISDNPDSSKIANNLQILNYIVTVVYIAVRSGKKSD
ncbi:MULTISPECIES: hypothetical protein [unclassified Gemella]|uniref:hypothetical protein n=1 Tax=unclassified Gemella TaxID=2624949 RepID=UPI0014313D9F|nr:MULTISPECIES: hypothetical protein [unclassified Gemella]MBF0710330.1 hypothetical protein [Gemella sp. GL1.1]MBF0747006.1 hypothetical protein [Gemella sp. 19428wG2_WT2a]NYS27674.1 hypothetical protein [Gemella sp. GL1]